MTSPRHSFPPLRSSYGFFTDNLTANPIDYITDIRADRAQLPRNYADGNPAARITGWNAIIGLRRMLGLFAFFLRLLHLLTGRHRSVLRLAESGEDIVKRPFITIGHGEVPDAAALAITSNAAMIRRLGKRWQQLHRLAYVAAVTAVIHFWWS